MDDNHLKEIDQMKIGISATYELIDNFEEFRREQDTYNKEVLIYLDNLHALVEDLNATTNRKLDMILSAGGQNSEAIIEKILLLNESFERLSKAYQPNIEKPNLDDNKAKKNIQFDPQIIPLDDNGNELKDPGLSTQVRKIDTITKK
jgi:aspartokinase